MAETEQGTPSRRRSAYRAVASLAVVAGSILAANLVLMSQASVGRQTLTAWLAAPASVLVLAVAVTYWAWGDHERVRHVSRVSMWAYLGAVVMGIGGGLTSYTQLAQAGASGDIVPSILGWAAGGLLPGGLVGIYDAERRIERRESERARRESERARREAEQLAAGLSVVNRVLRHDFRNHMTVLSGHIHAVAEDDPERAATMREHTQRITDLADRARLLEDILRTDEWVVVDAAEVVRRVGEDVAADHEDAVVELDCPGEVPVQVRGPLEVAVRDLVENAVVHNDSERPSVEVTVTDGPETVDVTVSDDGPGIPEHELAVLDQAGETPLEHSSGLGLWLVQWFADRSDGDLEIENTETGASVTLTLPAGTG